MSVSEYISTHREELGIHQFAFMKTADLIFSDGVRKLCEVNSCGQYGKTWACPPGVGSLTECKEKVLKYENLFVFTTMHPLEDSFDFEGMEDGKAKHNQVCPAIANLFREHYEDLLILSAEGCSRCDACTYPDAPCRFPETLFPSIESYGVEVNRLAAKAGVNYINGANTVTYFGCILY